jgi:hypothetical protein
MSMSVPRCLSAMSKTALESPLCPRYTLLSACMIYLGVLTIYQGMVDLIKKDTEKGIDDLF